VKTTDHRVKVSAIKTDSMAKIHDCFWRTIW